MTTYRLPEALGGAEVEIVTPAWAGHAIICEVALVADPSVKVSLARALLVEVKPPLPAEPGFGEFVATGADGNLLPIYRRWMDTGWNLVGGSAALFEWDELCAEAQSRAGRWPVRLVPDPFAEPLELPWQQEVGRNTTVTVDREGIDEIALYMSSGGRTMAPDIKAGEARSIARALWAAADEVDEATS